MAIKKHRRYISDTYIYINIYIVLRCTAERGLVSAIRTGIKLI